VTSPTSSNTLVLASAGTGKTFRLTSHFLALLLAGVEPKRILATTFTRKAAGEILARVLMQLARAAEDERALQDLREHTGVSDLDTARCVVELRRLVRSLHQFQVRTLDSFFVRTGTLFGLELGLPPGWSIAELAEADAIRAEAVGRLLAESEPEELIELLRELHGRPASRDVHESLLGLLGAGRAALLDSRPEAWECVRVPEAPDPALLRGALQSLEVYRLPRTQSGSVVKGWQGAVRAILECCEDGRWRDLLDSGLLKKVVAGETTYFRHPIDAALLELLRPVLGQLAHDQLGSLARRNRGMVELLAKLDVFYLQLLRERGKLRFEDVPALLDPRDGEAAIAPDDLWFRLDTQIDHLLLDEFQDTSALQWRVIAPLAFEIAKGSERGRSFFCVGDVKQCIYHWRQAEPRLLQQLPQLLPGLDEAEHLVESFRSSPVVLDTVDRVFGDLAQQPLFAEGPLSGSRDSLQHWCEGFDAHVAHYPSLPGGALLLEPPAEPEGGAASPGTSALELAAARIDSLLERHPRASIGVLFRSNKSIPSMMLRLGRRDLRASGEGGNPLTDSVASLHLLALMTLADHPGNRLAALAVATSAFGRELGWKQEPWNDRQTAARIATGIRRRLASEGYGAFCASFSKLVAAEYGGWDRRRYAQLVDLAEAWSEPDALRPARFVAHVLRTRVEDPSGSNIQCMTVHASKGLEFDAVFLPELGWELARASRELLTQRDRPAGLLDKVCVAVSEPVANLDPQLQALYAAGKGRSLEESLSILYVALTRARHWLEMIVPSRDEPQRGATAAKLLREVLGEGEPDGAGVLFRHPDTDADAVWSCDERQATPQAPSIRLAAGLGLQSARRPRSLPVRTPSHSDARTAAVGALLRSPGRTELAIGTLVHRLLEEVEWLEDFAQVDADLEARLAPLEADRDTRLEALALFRAGIAQPAIADLLSRGNHSGEQTVWRERRFCTELPEPDGTTSLWSGAIDRLVLQMEQGKPVAADVIDFKSDRIPSSEVDARSEGYRSQMQAYQRVVAVQTGLDANRIRARLVFLGPGRVQSL
jgi:ATP-dependent exoDNAse (exonuclease V) beta subunit